MAYDFDGSTDLFTAPVPSISDPCSISVWLYADEFASFPNPVVLDKGDLTDGFRIGLGGGLVYAHSRFTDASQESAQTSTTFSLSTWVQAGGVFTSDTSRTAYLNGGGQLTNTNSKVVGACTQISIGGFDNAGAPLSGLDGRVAEVGVWNVALTDGEMAILGQGYSPRFVRPSALVFYAPLIRDLQDVRGGAAFTTIGTPSVVPHPRVIQPRRRRPSWWTAPPPPPETLFAQACL